MMKIDEMVGLFVICFVVLLCFIVPVEGTVDYIAEVDMQNQFYSYELKSDREVLFLLEQDGKLYPKKYRFHSVVIIPDLVERPNYYQISEGDCEIHTKK